MVSFSVGGWCECGCVFGGVCVCEREKERLCVGVGVCVCVVVCVKCV